LAAGYFGFGTVSCFLAAYFAVQITWYSGGWGFGFAKKHYHAARQIATAIVPGTSKSPAYGASILKGNEPSIRHKYG